MRKTRSETRLTNENPYRNQRGVILSDRSAAQGVEGSTVRTVGLRFRPSGAQCQLQVTSNVKQRLLRVQMEMRKFTHSFCNNQHEILQF